MRRLGFALALLPLACWAWTLRDPCGPQGESWRECWAEHQGEHAAPLAESERQELPTFNPSHQ